MNEIEREIKTLQFIEVFRTDTIAVIKKLQQRYKDHPNDPADIVANTACTICTRIIVAIIPKQYWEETLYSIAKTLVKIANKGKDKL